MENNIESRIRVTAELVEKVYQLDKMDYLASYGKNGQVKMLSPAERVNREIDILALFIKSPNIVQLKETRETCLIFLNAGEPVGPSASQAMMIVKQILEGLKMIQSFNVVHRDIKPDNLLIDRHGIVRICDFALSSIVGDCRLIYDSQGTPAFTPPEAFDSLSLRTEGIDGFKRDLWSVGITLYILLTGSYPFQLSNDWLQIGQAIRSLKIGQDIHPLCEGLLHQNPKIRFNLHQALEYCKSS